MDNLVCNTKKNENTPMPAKIDQSDQLMEQSEVLRKLAQKLKQKQQQNKQADKKLKISGLKKFIFKLIGKSGPKYRTE